MNPGQYQKENSQKNDEKPQDCEIRTEVTRMSGSTLPTWRVPAANVTAAAEKAVPKLRGHKHIAALIHVMRPVPAQLKKAA